MPLHDFALPDADAELLRFDATFRQEHNTLLSWYRGYW